MKVCGIICEYNPFHSGHKYQITKAKEKADVIVAVMSGSFTQRGEPAVFDKWTRANAAVLCGANLVIELPFFAACAPAEYFASYAVRLLSATGIVNSLSFGSESGDLTELSQMADFCENSSEIKKYLSEGVSYSKAVAEAAGADFFTPNNILAIEYLRAIKKYAPQIEPFTVKRLGESYDSENTSADFISAAGCRKLILEGNFQKTKKYVPEAAYKLYETEIKNGNFSEYKNIDSLFIGLLRRDGEFLKDIAYVSEGLHHRFYKAAQLCGSINEVAEAVKSKRYTRARINRIIANALIGITTTDLNGFLTAEPQYIRVLAADDTGLSLIKSIKIPVITNASQIKKLNPAAQLIWNTECKASDIYAQTVKNPDLRQGGQDYTHFFVKV